jgi:ribosome biogenesis GTPase
MLRSTIVDLQAIGWDPYFEQHFEAHGRDGLAAARVTLEHQHIYTVHTVDGESLATVSGGLRHRAAGRHEFPAVGDWVAITPGAPGRRAVIQAILPRRSKFSRKVAGRETTEQVVAANIDTVFLMMGLDGDYNLRRIERYLITARDGGASPVVVLNKADLCDAVDLRVQEVQSVAQSAPVHAVSTKQGGALGALEPYLTPGRTIALLGSSGVGKSTLVNRLVGHQMQATQDVRVSDSRGRHTTTRRQLIIVTGGALLIDTPGLRELQLWDGAGGMDETFDDVEVLGAGCRFRDCRHEAEPGCAVKAAVDSGHLDASRLDSYRQLRRERAALLGQQDERAAQERKRQSRMLSKLIRQHEPRE